MLKKKKKKLSLNIHQNTALFVLVRTHNIFKHINRYAFLAEADYSLMFLVLDCADCSFVFIEEKKN